MGKQRSSASRELSVSVQEAFGARLKQIRVKTTPRFTQDMIASALEVSRTSVSNIENGRHRIFLDQVYAAAHVLNVPVSSLLPNTEELFSSPSVHSSPSAGITSQQLEELGPLVEAAISKHVGENRRSRRQNRTAAK